MQHTWMKWIGVAMVGTACAGGGLPEPESPTEAVAPVVAVAPKPARPYRPGEMTVDLGDEPDAAVGVELERGFLNQNDVNAVLEKHVPSLTACYDRAGDARRYAAGEVKLRFLVATSGEVTDVLVIGNQLGSYPVERCLVVEGRKIPFPKPGGDRPADFDYTIEFRASHAHTVLDRKGDQPGRPLTKQLARKVPSLGRCGSPGAGAVAAIAYVKPGGRVVSVGLSSDKPIDTLAAKCVVDQIQSWRLPADKGHLVRTQFAVSKGAPATTPAAAAAPVVEPLAPAIGPTARLKRRR